MKLIKKAGLGVVSVLKLDPVRTVAYHLIKEFVIYGSKALSKSTRNTLDDKIASKLERTLRTDAKNLHTRA
jgi:hypothetical protein